MKSDDPAWGFGLPTVAIKKIDTIELEANRAILWQRPNFPQIREFCL